MTTEPFSIGDIFGGEKLAETTAELSKLRLVVGDYGARLRRIHDYLEGELDPSRDRLMALVRGES